MSQLYHNLTRVEKDNESEAYFTIQMYEVSIKIILL